jgi:predicted ATPase/DNA-binding XRE family transcriptional regulator
LGVEIGEVVVTVEASFGRWLQRRRKALDLTQEELAQRVGCASETLRKIEADVRRPSRQIAERLAEALEIPEADRAAFIKAARAALAVNRLVHPTHDIPQIAFVPPPPSKKPTTNLPAPLTTFIGREKEQAEVIQLITRHRLATLTGPGGIGKTRLSIKVGEACLRHYADGVWIVELAPILDPLLVPRTTATAIGLRDEQQRPVIDMLSDHLREKNMLLILDNCEHLLDACAQLANTLLKDCPSLKILATSREALRILGEWLYAVPPLDLPKANSSIDIATVSQFSALTLFAERARAVRSDFALNEDNIKTVTMICMQLDGLPLAIELIAARARFMSPQTLLTKLSDPFVFSADGVRAGSPRQKTLHNAIRWSYDLLTEPEQLLFRRLSIFAGGFSLEAVKAVCAQGKLERKDIFDLLGRLIDKSLVIVEGVSTSHEARYYLLETIRQYAFEKLKVSEEVKSLRLLHLTFFAEMVEEAERNFKGPLQAVWYDQLDHELDNLRAALTCFEGSEHAEIRLRFAAGLWRYWKSRGQSSEGRGHLQRTLERLPPGPVRQTPAYARALTAAGSLAYYEGDFSYSEQSRKEALAIFRNLDDQVGIADCLNGLGNTAISQADYESARVFYEESLTIRKNVGDTWGVARLLGNLGLLAYFQGNYVQAYALHSDSLALFRELRDDEGVANELVNLGDVALHQAELSSALAFYTKSSTISRGLKDQWGLAYAILGIANVTFEQGDFSTAFSLYRECLSMFLEEADYIGLPYALESVAALAIMKNQLEKATRIFAAADALRKRKNSPMPLPDSATYQKKLSVLQGQLDRSNFEAAWIEGRVMTMEQAVEYALEDQE